MQDGRLGRAPKEGSNSQPPSSQSHCSMSLQRLAVHRLQFCALRQNPGVRSSGGTLAQQRLQRALFHHVTGGARHHGCPPPACVGVVNSSHVHQQ